MQEATTAGSAEAWDQGINASPLRSGWKLALEVRCSRQCRTCCCALPQLPNAELGSLQTFGLMAWPCLPGVLEGFTVSRTGKASLLWSAAFPPEEESVQGAAAPAFNSPIYSYAKARRRPHASSSMLLQALASDSVIPAGCYGNMLSLHCKRSSGSVETLWDRPTGRRGANLWRLQRACGQCRCCCSR